MDSETNEPKKFSYPNADRIENDTGEITGPRPTEANNLTQDELRQTVHLTDALSNNAPEKTVDMQNIRTFQSDVANAVKTDNVSLIKIALAEKKRQERQGTLDSVLQVQESSNTGVFIGIAAVLVIFAAGALFLYFALKTETVVPDTGLVSISVPAFETEKNVDIDIRNKDSNDIERLLQAEKTAELPIGSIERVRFTATNELGATRELSAEEWLAFMRVRAPSSLLRSFEPGFIYGIYSITPRDSFIILKILSYDNAYAGMLEWETSMEDDIGGVIVNKKLDVIGEDGLTSTTTQQENNVFVDRVISNKDTRVLLDKNGKIKILYSFIDQNTLVIASGESVLREVIFRLTTGRITR